jgi:CHASE1-domain containing sensor protein
LYQRIRKKDRQLRLTDNAAYRAFIAAATIFFLFLIFFSHTFLNNKQQLEEQKNLEVILADFSLRAIERIQAAVENLRGVSLIVAFDENPNFEQFQSYTLEYLGDSANWLVIEWQPIVKSQERSSFEAYVQEHIFPEFQLWEMDSSGNTLPATDREEHVPVLFMVSNTPAIDTTGLDLAWSEERMESKWHARDYGQARMSQLFNVVLSQEETSGPLGFAVTLPVFQDAIIPKSPQLRKQKIKGYIAGVYALEALLAEELNALKKTGIPSRNR